jgi:hypothetical protein
MLRRVTSEKNKNLTYIPLLHADMKKNITGKCSHKVARFMLYGVISSWNIGFKISSWLVE